MSPVSDIGVLDIRKKKILNPKTKTLILAG